MSRFVNPKRKQLRLRPAQLAIAGLAALIAAGDHAGATDRRGERFVESIEQRSAGEPIMAIVSLHSQRITVYDANGWILRAPVSSGQQGRETPAGIFSVIQKEAEHYSNLYDDAFMPDMQRITWSGIALHGGRLPGYPASHGCVRMPFDFAERLFDATRLGLRVIVAPTDVVPVEIAHPALFPSKPGAGALAAAETVLGSAIPAEARAQAERDKAQAVDRIAALQVQLDGAKAQLQPKLDAVTRTREAAVIAETARAAAAEAARQVARQSEPVSVLISRKTQRLYVRQAFEPILESPVTIQDADRPIGTHVFTAMERTSGDTNMRWSVVSLDGGRPHDGVVELQDRARGGPDRDAEPMPTDPDSAKTALDRIVIPPDALDRIAGFAPRSSLIITDEALSSETGKGTDFVVLLSGEPQGGIKSRRRGPGAEFGYARRRDRLPFSFWRSPFGGPFSSW